MFRLPRYYSFLKRLSRMTKTSFCLVKLHNFLLDVPLYYLVENNSFALHNSFLILLSKTFFKKHFFFWLSFLVHCYILTFVNMLVYLFLSIYFSMCCTRLFWSSWWRWGESNSWPPACKAGALANWATPPYAICFANQSRINSEERIMNNIRYSTAIIHY